MNLRDFDIILVNTSAGKDSQAMSDYVMQLAREADVVERVVFVHADLGRVEWQGTMALAAEHAAHYGRRFEVVRREKRDLLEEVEARGMWPDKKNRYCTSYYKRDQVAKVITKLVDEHLALYPRKIYGAAKVLNCIGIRAQESPEREKMQPLEVNVRLTNGKRVVTDWLPLHNWTLEMVWDHNRAAGTRSHYAYDLGMPRLSCVFCVFAPKAALEIAGRHNPELLDAYVAVEEKIGHTFTHKLSIASVREAIRSGAPVAADVSIAEWCA